MPSRLVQTLAVLAAAAVAPVVVVAGTRRLRSNPPRLPAPLRRWSHAAARTVTDDVEALFI